MRKHLESHLQDMDRELNELPIGWEEAGYEHEDDVLRPPTVISTMLVCAVIGAAFLAAAYVLLVA